VSRAGGDSRLRLGDRLTLRITYESAPGKESEASGGLQWDQPQSVDDVQKVLRVHVGQPIRAIGDLDV